MTTVHYSLSNHLYKSNIFTGFSQLLKQEEFVDLTLAADGCMVKVHKSLIALASPYLREVLKSMPSNSPAIFLNNVSDKILTYLLEYIYQGEVKIPADSVDAFIEVSKSLHIAGVEDLKPPKETQPLNKNRTERRIHNNSAHMTIDNDNLMEVQEYPTSDNLENNANYEIADNNVTTQYQPENILNNAKFIVLQNEDSYNIERHNQEYSDTDLLANAPIDISNYRQGTPTPIARNLKNQNVIQHVANMPDQLAQNSQNIPTIEINGRNIISGQQNQQTNTKQCTDYKIIVKGHIDTEQLVSDKEPLQNIPVIEIQHFGVSGQLEHNMHSQNYILPQTDISSQDFQENSTLPQTCLMQNQNNKTNKPIIRILDDQIIKTNADMPSSVSFDCKMNALKNMSQFSITERGQVHLILNRYLYYCHHMTLKKRRWRCVDYRRVGCPAFVDTKSGVIVARKGIHTHSFHDNKIYKKHKKGLIYQTMELALAAREKLKKEQLITVSVDTTDDES